MIKQGIIKIRERIASACRRAGRQPAEIILVAVSKGRTVDEMRAAFEAGITHIGESRVQEAKLKYDALREESRKDPVGWHMVGHLQRNKVRQAVALFELIHSVDSVACARAVDREAARIHKVQDILLEIKTSPETSKYGIHPEEAAGVLRTISAFDNIAVKGLMTIAPYKRRGEDARPYFRTLRQLRDNLNAQGAPTRRSISSGQPERLRMLSMGMTDDFETAIEEGATMVRIGRAIFEERG
ncbi:MAG: YggS family pyridoxal phosphate-dependent enzyme [Candidatus Omnitrophica bacterium]|nr:YggS family pyridoxal phosphate-dependent enzyme [Candidatus Omnitrophota bacterium]